MHERMKATTKRKLLDLTRSDNVFLKPSFLLMILCFLSYRCFDFRLAMGIAPSNIKFEGICPLI